MKQIIKALLNGILAPIRLLLHGRLQCKQVDENYPLEEGVDKNLQLPNDKFLPIVRQVIQEGHSATIRVKGFSMRPFLETCRDKVILSQPTGIKVGDAVLAEIEKGHFVLHRIILIEGTHVTLMGDGNTQGTETCEVSDIAGKVTTFIRNGKPISSQSQKWRIYSYIWPRLLPLRPYLLFVYRSLI
jgi:hypothetical protein